MQNKEDKKVNLFRIFCDLAKTKETGKTPNKIAYAIFEQLCHADKDMMIKNYILADELQSLINAVKSLDEHITNLMGRVSQLSSEIEGLKKKDIIKRERKNIES